MTNRLYEKEKYALQFIEQQTNLGNTVIVYSASKVFTDTINAWKRKHGKINMVRVVNASLKQHGEVRIG